MMSHHTMNLITSAHQARAMVIAEKRPRDANYISKSQFYKSTKRVRAAFEVPWTWDRLDDVIFLEAMIHKALPFGSRSIWTVITREATHTGVLYYILFSDHRDAIEFKLRLS